MDARDPLGTRSDKVEQIIKNAGPEKKLILILNKTGKSVSHRDWGGSIFNAANQIYNKKLLRQKEMCWMEFFLKLVQFLWSICYNFQPVKKGDQWIRI